VTSFKDRRPGVSPGGPMGPARRGVREAARRAPPVRPAEERPAWRGPSGPRLGHEHHRVAGKRVLPGGKYHAGRVRPAFP
jgi:hypothetical protein